MKLSLFTPTHRPGHLAEVYASIMRQDKSVPWEWILALNGTAMPHHIPENIREDPHVKLTLCDKVGIGALKRFACEQCTGDVFVELDHDDILASNAFSELCTAVKEVPNGFYYSDFINIKPDGQCETYNPKFGWILYEQNVDGRNYIACRAFEPSARSLCQIFFAPNHIRAWSRDAYMKSGGHDQSLVVGDDHDLVCRTYIAGVPFKHIRKPLYIYRRWSDNSFIKFNKTVQQQQAQNCNKYLHPLIVEECKRRNLPLIDIGRDEWRAEGFSSAELKDIETTDDSSIGCIRAVDCLQKVPQNKLVRTMNKFYDVLTPGGWLLASMPSIDDGDGKVGRGVFQDPSHQSYWSENNFWYYTQRQYANLLPDYYGRFQAVQLKTDYPTDWHKKHVIPYVSADLCALKGQRHPGKCLI